MIKVIEGLKVKPGTNIQPILLKLRTQAMTYPGFIGADNLISEKDNSIIAMISTWEKPEYWFAWESSKIRQNILREAKALLLEEPRVMVYKLIPTVAWLG